MRKKKNRWAEVNGGHLCLVDGDGQILARVTRHIIGRHVQVSGRGVY
jgi:hypothetical protein